LKKLEKSNGRRFHYVHRQENWQKETDRRVSKEMTKKEREDIERVVRRSTLRAVIYARVSTDKQEDDGTSLDTQVENCEKLASTEDLLVIETFREVFTGSLYRERKDLTKIRQMARNHEFEVLLINTFDRLSRNQTHLAVLIEEMEHLKIKVYCVKENFDETATGQFMRSALGFVAEVEREKIIQRTQDGIMKRINGGKLLPGWKARYGYAWASPDKEALVTKCEEMSVVREIFRLLVSERRPVERIAKILSERQIPSPTGLRYWDKSTVFRILTDPIYIGKARAKKDSVQHVGGRIERKRRPDDEIIYLPDGLVPPIIDEQTFKLAQEILSLNKLESDRNNPKSKDDLLRCGFIRCGYCKRVMTSTETKTGSRKKKGTATRYYMCFYRYRSNRRCMHSPSISCKKIDNAVWDYVGKLIQDFSLVEKAIALAKEKGDFLPDLESILASIESAKSNQDQLLDDLKEKDEKGTYKLKGRSRDLVIEELGQVDDYLVELEEEKEKILQGQLKWEEMQKEVDKFVAWCLNARETYPTASFEEKRRALRMLGITVYVYRDGDPDHTDKYEIRLKVPHLADILLRTS
jgi:site-specific DNA recombinase